VDFFHDVFVLAVFEMKTRLDLKLLLWHATTKLKLKLKLKLK